MVQGSRLQAKTSLSAPKQSFPEPVGLGLLHTRVLLYVPWSHVAVQSEEVHWPQLPSIV